jgi:hypothetical protein
VVALLGIVICMVGTLSIWAALTAIRNLKQHYHRNCPNPHPRLPSLTADATADRRGRLAPQVLPLCFVGGWLLVLLMAFLPGLHRG